MTMQNNIKVNVQVDYAKNHSDVARKQHAFTYTITIENLGDLGAQLLTRRWIIQDELGNVEEVVGEGVIEKQPHITPGEAFEYSSGAVIKTPTGTMKGAYSMINDKGERFEVPIDEFVLSEPYTLH